MTLGLPSRIRAEMNLTPMIDVLLVLIIIFMVITPTTSHGLEVLVPQPSKSPAPARSDIVITVRIDGTVQLNGESMDLRMLESRLTVLLRNGVNQAIFLRGDSDLKFARIAKVIDLARGVGAFRVGLMTN